MNKEGSDDSSAEELEDERIPCVGCGQVFLEEGLTACGTCWEPRCAECLLEVDAGPPYICPLCLPRVGGGGVHGGR